MKLKVLLVKCPRVRYSHFEENSESLALGYLAASLRKNRYEVDVLDASLQGLSLDETIDSILEKPYGLIGFTIADPTFIEPTVKAIAALRERRAKAHITMGGHSPTFHCKEVLQMCSGLDSIVMYEGERTVVELADTLSRCHDWRGVMSIAYRNISGVHCNPPRPLIADLDTLPFPARDTIQLVLENAEEGGAVSMAGGRGCPMDCGFCSIRAFYDTPAGSPWRVRSNRSVVDEMKHLVKTYGIGEILLVDDVFVGPGEKNKNRILELADEIRKSQMAVMLSVAERVDNIDEEVFKQLRDIGVRSILLGIESGDQESLDYFHKGITLEQIQKAIEILQQLDIDIKVSFINFTPLTTLEQIRENVGFFVSLGVNILQGLLNRFQIYGGTPLGERLLNTGSVHGEFPNFYWISRDKRVDLVYHIAQKSLGTFLAAANELNKLERTLRIKAFDAEVNEDGERIALLRSEKAKYRKIVNQIVEEAADLLLETMSFAEINSGTNSEKIRRFTNKMVETSLTLYEEWLGLVQFFRMNSPALNTSPNCHIGFGQGKET